MLAGLFSVAALGEEVIMLPYRRSTKRMPVREPSWFTEVEFVEQFRFRRDDFFRILACLRDDRGRYLMKDGAPIALRIGKLPHSFQMRADKALMILLQRLSYPCRWCDMQIMLGGSRTELSATYNHMLSMLYARYASLASNISVWRYQFRRFAAHFTAWGCVFDNLVGMFDGHFCATCRPGGDGNVNTTLWDHQTFAGKERLHGLKYQGMVLPNGIALVWGPWRGTEHDSTMFRETGFLDCMRTCCDELGDDFCGFGDSAYPLHR
jgi:hypothetical protein